MTICYNTNCFKYTSISILIICIIGLLSTGIIDYVITPCNDAYHSIDPCLNSSNCDERYCEPTTCKNYTCLPRIYKVCKHDNKLFYPELDKCPNDIIDDISWVRIILSGISLLVVIIYLITLIHYRCHYYYQYVSDGTDWNDQLNNNPNSNIVLCDLCNGAGRDMIYGAYFAKCNGQGRILSEGQFLLG